MAMRRTNKEEQGRAPSKKVEEGRLLDRPEAYEEAAVVARERESTDFFVGW